MANKRFRLSIAALFILALSGLGVNVKTASIEMMPAVAQITVSFSGKAHRDGVNIRSAPSTSSSIVGRLQPNEQVNFDAWTYGDIVNDVWTGQPDARWYRVPGKGWVASAVIAGNAPDSTQLPGNPPPGRRPDFGKREYRQDNPLWQAGFAPKSVNPPIYRMSNPVAQGNCTWYASGRSKELGRNASNVNRLTADAGNWDDQARAARISMSKTPSVGAIAQWEAANNNGFGHVAVVERVNGDGTILISESSYVLRSPSSWDFLYRTRTVRADNPSIYILP
jgi:surface antigen